MAITAVGVVVVIVVALVVWKVASGSSTSSNSNAPVAVPANPSTVAAVENIPPSVMNAVGVPSSSVVAAPSVLKGQPPLTSGGKPASFAVLAEFCPLCAAERWPTLLAFSKFGSFSKLLETTSSPWDTYPDTATFSFRGTEYTSSYLAFDPIEHETNDTGANGQGRTLLEPLTAQQARLWSKYSAHFGISEGFPFIDIGNKVFVTGPQYNPQNLAGLTQSQIAAKLSNPNDPVTQAIVGSANYLMAGICSITGQQPSSVCSISAVTQASHAMGLS